MKLEANSLFGQYRVIRLLGRGGMGEVHEVEHSVLGLRYALKLLPPDLVQRPDALKRFQSEARVMAQMQHDNIVRVDEFGETDRRYWLRMQLIKGIEAEVITLSDFAAQQGGKISEKDFTPILGQMLEALAYAHEKGVVHRDLKPGNILLEKDSAGQIRVKVSDFGLARVIGEEAIRNQAQLSITRSISEGVDLGQTLGGAETIAVGDGTSTRALLGTWEYMSPEQKQGKDADKPSDIYAVGLMTYRLLTGQELGRKAPSRLVPGLRPEWDEFIDKAVEQVAAERYADGKEMLTAFLKFNPVQKSVGEAPHALRPNKPSEPELEPSEPPSGVGAQVSTKETTDFSTAGGGGDTAEGGSTKTLLKPVLVLLALALLAGGGVYFWNLQKERTHQRIVALRSSITNALATDNLDEANRSLTQLQSISRAETSDLKSAYEAKVAEAEALQKKMRASQTLAGEAREKVLQLERGAGFSNTFEALDNAWNEAQSNSQHNAWKKADAAYQVVAARAQEITVLDQARTVAYAARKKAVTASVSALSSEANELAQGIWKEAESARQSAEMALLNGSFSEAEQGFSKSVRQYEDSASQARNAKAFRGSKKQFEQLAADTASSDLLRQYASSEWESIRSLVKKAEDNQDTQAGTDAYDQAAKLWPSALDIARLEKKKKDRELEAKQKQEEERVQKQQELAKQEEAKKQKSQTSQQQQTAYVESAQKAAEQLLGMVKTETGRLNTNETRLRLVPFSGQNDTQPVSSAITQTALATAVNWSVNIDGVKITTWNDASGSKEMIIPVTPGRHELRLQQHLFGAFGILPTTRANASAVYEIEPGITYDVFFQTKFGTAPVVLKDCYAVGCDFYSSQNYPAAVEWFRKAAEQGSPDGQNWLGFCYQNGVGVPKDDVDAVKWYRRSAEKGNISAQNSLGACFLNGIGISKDEKEAVKWFSAAAEKGEPNAQCNLGWCYANGVGISKNMQEAVRWWRKAAAQGNQVAKSNLEKLGIN